MTATEPAPAVVDLLPHRYPMLLVDRVVELVPGERITATKAVTHNEPWYAALVPGQDPAYPLPLLIESWGQAAGVLASATAPDARDQVMLFGSVTNARFHRAARPGDLIEHLVRVDRMLDDSVVFEGESRCAGELLMSVERMVMAFRPASLLRPVTAAPSA